MSSILSLGFVKGIQPTMLKEFSPERDRSQDEKELFQTLSEHQYHKTIQEDAFETVIRPCALTLFNWEYFHSMGVRKRFKKKKELIKYLKS